MPCAVITAPCPTLMRPVPLRMRATKARHGHALQAGADAVKKSAPDRRPSGRSGSAAIRPRIGSAAKEISSTIHNPRFSPSCMASNDGQNHHALRHHDGDGDKARPVGVIAGDNRHAVERQHGAVAEVKHARAAARTSSGLHSSRTRKPLTLSSSPCSCCSPRAIRSSIAFGGMSSDGRRSTGRRTAPPARTRQSCRTSSRESRTSRRRPCCRRD